MYTYDHLGRRVQKVVSTYNGTVEQWEQTAVRKFIWDGWLLLLELDGLGDGGTPGEPAECVVRKYTWGLDLAGRGGSVNSRESAGGIGGLLAVEQAEIGGGAGAGGVDAGDYVYFYDANGNVGQVVAWASGFGGTTDFAWDTTPPTLARVVARYEYDPFGNVIGPDTDGDGKFEPDGDDDPGVYAGENAWRFSTKPFDPATGLGLWGERWYHPSLGRWMSRDPIGEVGGLNLYAYVVNEPISHYDSYGLVDEGYPDPLGNPSRPPRRPPTPPRPGSGEDSALSHAYRRMTETLNERNRLEKEVDKYCSVGNDFS